MFYTYILQSQKTGRYYIGHTADLKERLNRHHNGLVSATRNKGLWAIVYYEQFETKLEANQRELHLKKMKSRLYIEKLIQSNKT